VSNKATNIANARAIRLVFNNRSITTVESIADNFYKTFPVNTKRKRCGFAVFRYTFAIIVRCHRHALSDLLVQWFGTSRLKASAIVTGVDNSRTIDVDEIADQHRFGPPVANYIGR